MPVNETNFRLFNLLENMKILRDKEKNLFAYLPFFPSRPLPDFDEYRYGFIKNHDEIIYFFSKEEWSNLMCITC